jgi:hypothetical protein
MGIIPVTNVLSSEWAVSDEVIRLRAWRTDRVDPLFLDGRGSRSGPLRIAGSGSGSGSAIEEYTSDAATTLQLSDAATR